jgi:hypothetical protein
MPPPLIVNSASSINRAAQYVRMSTEHQQYSPQIIGVDLNTLAHFVSTVKTTPLCNYDTEILQEWLIEAQEERYQGIGEANTSRAQPATCNPSVLGN